MSADISAEIASKVSNVVDSLTEIPIYTIQDYVGQLEHVKLRVLHLLEPELDQNQLRAFNLGYDLPLTKTLCHTPCEESSERIAFVQTAMVRIYQSMTELGMDGYS